MTQDGLLEISDIIDSLVIDKKFVLVDSTKYTDDAFEYILSKVDEVGSIAFISNTKKIYAKGQYYSDFDDLRYYKSIASGFYDIYNNLGITDYISAQNPAADLVLVGKGATNIQLDKTNGAVIINTDLSGMQEQTLDVLERIRNIENSYASQDYVADNYQEILVPGAYIQIDQDTNVISTYNLVTYAYAFENYATYSYIGALNEELYSFEHYITDNYPNNMVARQIAADEASKAVAKVVDNAPAVFDTLKEISDWIIGSGEYVLVSPDNIIDDGEHKYYIKEYTEADNSSLDLSGNTQYYEYNQETSQYTPIEIGNINTENPDNYYYTVDYKDAPQPIDTTGNTEYYIYTASSAAELLGDITELQKTVGHEYYYYYLDSEGKEQIYNGTISSIQDLGDNQYFIEDEVGNNYTVSYVASTGLFDKIEKGDEALDYKIELLKKLVNETIGISNSILYNLYAGTTTSYAYLTFDKYEYANDPDRTIIMNVVEGEFDNNPESEKYGNVITNGLTTTYTVNSMMDYRNGWIILQGEEFNEP